MNRKRIVELAIEAGFNSGSDGGLGFPGMSEDDILLRIGEYPTGEAVFKLCELLLAEHEGN